MKAPVKKCILCGEKLKQNVGAAPFDKPGQRDSASKEEVKRKSNNDDSQPTESAQVQT